MAAFTAYMSNYNQAYLASFDTMLANLQNIVNNKIKIAELKVITERLYNSLYEMQKQLSLIEGIVMRTSGLTIKAKDFRIVETRKMIFNNNIEAVAIEASHVVANISNNKTVLQAKGLTVQMQSSFQTLLTNIMQDTILQNVKTDEKEAVVQENLAFFNEAYTNIKDIADVGKRLFKYTDKEKLEDYTVNKIKNRITRKVEKKATEIKMNASIEGVARDFETQALMAGVKVWSNASAGFVMTNDKGYFKLPVNAEEAETLYAEFVGYKPNETDIELDAGVDMINDIDMEKEEVEG
jgi:hypothetical protein